MFERSRIKFVVFDLDGTLVETEHLKAQAYAEIIGELTGKGSPEPAAIDLYRSMVGATDLVICDAMIEQFSLEPLLRSEQGESSIDSLHRQRMDIYKLRYGTPENLSKQVYEHNIQLARTASAEGLPVGVATMSFAVEAHRVIEAIGLKEIVDTVVGVDDVTRPKPAPDAFLLAMDRLGATPSQTLIMEDSPRGAHAAAASGAEWLCVATEFSSDALRKDTDLDQDRIVWDPSQLSDFITDRISG